MIDPILVSWFAPISAIVLSISCLWLGLYFLNKKSINMKTRKGNFLPRLSVLVPAYNEEKAIGNTLKSVFNSIYPKDKLDVIVLNDGSTDNTAKVARKFPVRLFNLKHKGKVYALNKGIEKAKGDFILTLDADTKLEPYTLNLMIQKFKDPKIGAVSGSYKARKNNHKSLFYSLLEKIQTLEYLGFTLIRKQQEVLNSILVVPGAIAAYRKDVLKKVGGFDDDTMIEDYDITIKIHKAGYKVRCDKNALGYVNAPQNIKKFIRQRTRWYRGGLQTLRKHFDVFHTRLGMITFLWAFDVLGMILQLMVFTILSGVILYNIAFFPMDFLIRIKLWLLNLLSFNLFSTIFLLGMSLVVIGFISTTISIKITNESKRKLLLYPLMTVYSTFLFFIFLKSFIQEILNMKRVW